MRAAMPRWVRTLSLNQYHLVSSRVKLRILPSIAPVPLRFEGSIPLFGASPVTQGTLIVAERNLIITPTPGGDCLHRCARHSPARKPGHRVHLGVRRYAPS